MWPIDEAGPSQNNFIPSPTLHLTHCISVLSLFFHQRYRQALNNHDPLRHVSPPPVGFVLGQTVARPIKRQEIQFCIQSDKKRLWMVNTPNYLAPFPII